MTRVFKNSVFRSTEPPYGAEFQCSLVRRVVPSCIFPLLSNWPQSLTTPRTCIAETVAMTAACSHPCDCHIPRLGLLPHPLSWSSRCHSFWPLAPPAISWTLYPAIQIMREKGSVRNSVLRCRRTTSEFSFHLFLVLTV